MKLRNLILKGLLCLLAVPGMTSGAVARDKGDEGRDHGKEHDIVREALRRGEVLPLGEILAIAEQHVPGDVIEVELESDRKQALVYEIKILTRTGRVREVRIDARTGQCSP